MRGICRHIILDGYALNFPANYEKSIPLELITEPESRGVTIKKIDKMYIRVYDGTLSYRSIDFMDFMKSILKDLDRLAALEDTAAPKNVQTCAKCRHLYASVYRDENGDVRTGCMVDGHCIKSNVLDEACCSHFAENINETND